MLRETVFDNHDGPASKLFINRRRIAEKKEIGIEISHHVDGPVMVQNIERQRGSACPAIFSSGSGRFDFEKFLVFELCLRNKSAVFQIESVQNIIADIVHAQYPESEISAMLLKRV